MTLQLTRISKSFGAVRAVEETSLAIGRGEIVALVGENGAGKTTLMRIAAGELRPDAGSISREGQAELVHQHFMLVNELTIAENLALGRRGFRLTTRHGLVREAERTIAATGIALGDVTRLVGDLSVGEKSKLELIKAISRHPATLILDEPTSVLTPNESEELFAEMRRLAAAGTAVVFISHKLPEVLAIAQRIIVMRAGRIVLERGSDTTADELARAMVATPASLPSRAASQASRHSSMPALFDETPSLRPNAIAAIVGVAGNGQSELAARLRDHFAGGGHIPEDRTRDGLVAEMTIAENLALKADRWNPQEAERHAARLIHLYSIRAPGPRELAGNLSGGNQQKVLLARELDRRPAVLVAAEPTRGLDLEATRFVHEQLRSAAAAGSAVLIITSDLDEAFALADSIQVINRGRLSTPMTPEEASPRLASLLAGLP